MQRILCAISLVAPEKLSDALSALYRAFWVERKAIVQSDVVQSVLEEVLGEKLAKQILEAVSRSCPILRHDLRTLAGQGKGDDAKKLLSANTDKALEEGAFGLPWFVGMLPDGDFLFSGARLTERSDERRRQERRILGLRPHWTGCGASWP